MSKSAGSVRPKPRASTLGQQGEQFVAQWLQQQGWSILARGWSSRWGELDVVAFRSESSTLAFVEIKTRSSGNWDADGLLAITLSKQLKLWKTAQLFLGQHPHLAEHPCRFDVALVGAARSRTSSESNPVPPITLGQPIEWNGYRLTLRTYLESAFELD
jgi:putative endonuclease